MLQKHASKRPIKLYDLPMYFNVAEYEKFVDRIS